MISTETNIGRVANSSSRASFSLPFVVSGANVREANASEGYFTSVASSGWSFQQAETPAWSTFDFYVGSPVSGTWIVEQPNDLASLWYLTDLDSQDYRLGKVLTVTVQKSGDQFIASEPRRGWFGYGDSEGRAIGNFASGLVEELEGLSAREGQLSQHLRDELAQLRSVVIPRR